MDKESAYELQKIDCNCNNCGYMVRDMEAFEESVQLQYRMQKNYFESKKQAKIDKALEWKDWKNDIKKHDNIMKEVAKMKFVFDKSAAKIQFGNCSKFNKPVQFIPNVCQLDTQGCFKHRKDF